jgi:hypothetical protein
MNPTTTKPTPTRSTRDGRTEAHRKLTRPCGQNCTTRVPNRMPFHLYEIMEADHE